MRPSLSDKVSSRMRYGFGLSALGSRYARDSQFDATRFEAGLKYERSFSQGLDFGMSAGRVVDLARNARPGGDREGVFLTAEGFYKSRLGETNVLITGQQLKDQKLYNSLFFPGVRRDTRRFFATVRHEFPLNRLFSVSEQLLGYVQGTIDRSNDDISIFSVKNHIFTSGISVRF
jgi:hypothetical protein